MKKPAIKHPGLNLGDHHGAAHEQAEVAVFGFWVFLMSDLIIFGLMFATYTTMLDSTAGGLGPRDLFILESAFAQTMVLLTSSLTMGMSTLAMKYDLSRIQLTGWLALTLLLGVVFVLLELIDFQHMVSQSAGPNRSGFLSAFYGLVSLHGFHVAAGCVWLLTMILQVHILGLLTTVKTRLLRLGLFWHFLDIIWIGIFSIVYLGGLA